MLKTRRFSDGSPLVASYLKDRISKDVVNLDKSKLPYLETASRYSMVLPEDAAVGRHGSNSLEQDPYLIDRRMKITLEESRVINWCPGIRLFMPLSVPHDGNSLCHSASVAMWAIEDHNLVLRKLVFNALESDCQTELKGRWVYDRRKQRIKAGIAEEQEMVENEEWEVQLQLAKDTNKSSRPTHPIFEPLEEFHVFVLSNTLRRPIIVLSDCDPNYEAVCATSDGFSGIYLPVLWKSSECVHSPLILGYSDGSFSPLVSWGGSHIAEEVAPDVIPLVLEDQKSLHVRYLTKEEEMYRAQLLKDYLVVTEIEYLKPNKGAVMIAAAQLIIKTLDETIRLLHEFFQLRKKSRASIAKTSSNTTNTQINRKVSRFRCGNKECINLIEKDHTFPYCTECYEVKSVEAAKNTPIRRKVNYPPPSSPLTELDIDCAMPGCPYFASVNTFPFCKRCDDSSNKKPSPGKTTDKVVPEKEISVEDKWGKLAMGVYDADLVGGKLGESGSTEGATYSTTERIPFVQEEFALCAASSEEPIAQSKPLPRRKISATGNRSILMGTFQEPPRRKTSASGTRSLVTPQRRISREQLDHARNVIVVGTNQWIPVNTNNEQSPRRKVSATGMRSLSIPCRKQSTEEKQSGDWRRKVSWINQPCAQWGCSYFASTRTYPYCNQCASQRENAS